MMWSVQKKLRGVKALRYKPGDDTSTAAAVAVTTGGLSLLICKNLFQYYSLRSTALYIQPVVTSAATVLCILYNVHCTISITHPDQKFCRVTGSVLCLTWFSLAFFETVLDLTRSQVLRESLQAFCFILLLPPLMDLSSDLSITHLISL